VIYAAGTKNNAMDGACSADGKHEMSTQFLRMWD
jgi:hypothetical protein